MTLTLPGRLVPAAIALAALAPAARAGTDSVVAGTPAAPPPVAATEESAFDRLWGLATLYRSETNPFLQEFSLTGRYHGQFWAADADTGNGDDWENRRFRLGFRALLLDRTVEVKAEMFSNLNEDDDAFYDGLTEAYVRYSPSKAFRLTVGKQKPKFSQDWALSSRLIPTVERSALVNQFRPDYAPGVAVEGRAGNFLYYGGVFSADTIDDGDDSTNFGDFDGGIRGIAGLGYDFSESAGLDTAVARVDFIAADIDANDDLFNAFEYGVAGSVELKQKPWGLVTETIYGHLDSGGSNWALRLQPTYDVTDRLQLVARYQLGISSESTGLRTQSRYERAVGAGDGDLYNAAYAGLNYFIYDHKAKLMGGVEYANMDGPTGYDGWTAFAGVRVYW